MTETDEYLFTFHFQADDLPDDQADDLADDLPFKPATINKTMIIDSE